MIHKTHRVWLCTSWMATKTLDSCKQKKTKPIQWERVEFPNMVQSNAQPGFGGHLWWRDWFYIPPGLFRQDTMLWMDPGVVPLVTFCRRCKARSTLWIVSWSVVKISGQNQHFLRWNCGHDKERTLGMGVRAPFLTWINQEGKQRRCASSCLSERENPFPDLILVRTVWW